MKNTQIKCPGCGASIDLLEGRAVQFCQYCGTKILLEKEEQSSFDVKIGHDFFGIGKAVSSYVQAKDREKEREHEEEMAEEEYFRNHPEEKRRKDKQEFLILAGLFIVLVAGIIISLYLD